MKDKKTINKKAAGRKGTVVSDKMDKTVVVAAESYKTHSKYLKKYRLTKRYKVHDPENKYKIGDAIEFIESKPISKDKKFKSL
ncbi:30S ribosomal protein S17 [bacterium]|nr:30S ribosomal protein S17 [bacterium]